MSELKFRTRGAILIGPRNDDTGQPQGLFDAGCADEANINLTVDSFTHVEKCTGQDLEDFRGTKKKSGDLSLDLTKWTTPNVVMAFNGTRVVPAVESSDVSGEVLPDDLEAGHRVLLGGGDPHQNITDLVISDSASPTPTALDPDDLQYTLDAVNGILTIVNVDGLVQPLTASYTHQDDEKIALLNAPQIERWVSFVGVNVAQQNKPVRVNLYRVQFDPASLNLLPDELGHLPLKASILADSTKPLDGVLGRFGLLSRAA